jgi:two-component system chemotaxis response regulator CheB
MSNIRVFVVDDSAVVRQVLTQTLTAVNGIEVIGSAQDPIFAQAKMEKDWPDVIILDVEMPRMDGITFLKQIMSKRPTPVIMCSTLTEEGSHTSLKALSYGAIDVVAKPKANLKTLLPEASAELVSAIRTAMKANMKPLQARKTAPIPKVVEKLTADAVLSKTPNKVTRKSGAMIAVGASTGGTQALEAVLTALPANTLPILVVQHMPEKFTRAFAERLNNACRVEVKEAEDNDALMTGRVLIAPGGKHMMLQTNNLGAFVQVKDGPLVSRHKPSVDVLFRSVAKYAGSNALGIIMTGMGDDGARGLKEMFDVGAKTLGQNEDTCVVYGMPQEAMKLGAVQEEIPIEAIPIAMASHK